MRTFSALLAATLAAASPAAAQPPSTPTESSAAATTSNRMDWWRDARFGMFIHWGLYSIPAGDWNGKTCGGPSEWIMQSLKIPVSEYKKFGPQFNPVKYDPAAWARIAKDAGCKYVVITSRHHDGFCLWDSKVSDWDVAATPWKKDLLHPLADACRKEGLKFGLYYSIKDWRHPDYTPRRAWNDEQLPADGAKFDRFVEYVHAQVEEIIRGYDPDVLWFDGEWEDTWTTAHGEALEALCRRLKPDIIINNRVGKSRDDMAGLNRPGVKSLGDFCTPEQEVPSRGLPGVDWETCMTMNNSWGFKRSDHHWKSDRQLVHTLCDVASKGGNFLLNVGPTAEGEIPPESVERLAAVGRWMRENGDAIYGSQVGPFSRLPFGRCTSKTVDGTPRLYLHVFERPRAERMEIPGLRTDARRAWALADPSRALPATRFEEQLIIDLPPEPAPGSPSALAQVLALELKGPPDVAPYSIRALATRPTILDAESAEIEGRPLRIEQLDGKPSIGFWTDASGAVSWDVRSLDTRAFRVELDYSCIDSAAGNTFVLTLGDQQLEGQVPATGGWSSFKTLDAGTVTLSPGHNIIRLSAKPPLNHALMNLRAVRLTRAK